jgi:UDP-glucose-4-epimerase GalE
MTTVLVTGGAGYIGSHTCKALAQIGVTPVCYDDLSRGREESVKWGPLETGSIHDRARLTTVIRQYRPACIVHFAASAYVHESVQNPALYYRNNVIGTLSLLQAMSDTDVNRIVFSSTCATYGIPQVIPVTENTTQEPINPYGSSKLMIERILKDYEAAYGVRSVILRYFNAAGADPDGEIGENHDPEPHLIPRVLMAATGDLDAIEIMGDDYPTADGTAIRDYIHVCDLAEAHVKAVQRLTSAGKSLVVNLGTGRGASVREVLESAQRVTGLSIPVRIGKRRPGDPPILVASPEHAVRELGFAPRYVDMDEIVATAWQWHCRSRNRQSGEEG